MPEAPAATAVLSTTITCSPWRARGQAVDRPGTPAPMTRVGTEEGRRSGMGAAPGAGGDRGVGEDGRVSSAFANSATLVAKTQQNSARGATGQGRPACLALGHLV